MFDPYQQWLGISAEQRPPTYYQLLGITAQEQDAAEIAEAAQRRTNHLRFYQNGPAAADANRLLQEIAQARRVLCDPAQRRDYDARLKTSGRATAPASSTSIHEAPPVASIHDSAPKPLSVPSMTGTAVAAGTAAAPLSIPKMPPVPMPAAPSADSSLPFGRMTAKSSPPPQAKGAPAAAAADRPPRLQATWRIYALIIFVPTLAIVILFASRSGSADKNREPEVIIIKTPKPAGLNKTTPDKPKPSYVFLDLEPAATSVSIKPMLGGSDAERIMLSSWGLHNCCSVPFKMVDPEGGKTKNAILLHSPRGTLTKEMPKSVKVQCQTTGKVIHLLGGVSGWGFPTIKEPTVSLIVRLHYADGTTEDHPLKNGVHLADFQSLTDVPESKLALKHATNQLRYLALTPGQKKVIADIELVKGDDETAPLIMGITVEKEPR